MDLSSVKIVDVIKSCLIIYSISYLKLSDHFSRTYDFASLLLLGLVLRKFSIHGIRWDVSGQQKSMPF